MSTTTSRSRASLALATAFALVAAMFSIGISPASADPVFAKVTGHQQFSSDANKVGYWCGELGGTKVNPGGSSYVLPTGTYSKVIVKAGSGPYANTIFAEPPKAGETVWADTNGDQTYNPGGRGGDKNISHVILCNGAPEAPETTDLTVDKVWEYLGERPDGFELGNEDAGALTVTVAGKPTGQAWGKPEQGLAVGAEAKVLEGTVPDPMDPEGYTCTITGAPTYSVNNGSPVTQSTAFKLLETSNTVVVTNSVTWRRTVTEPAKGSVEAVKKWTVTGLAPNTGFTAGTPGTLTFNDDVKEWTNNTTSYEVNTEVKVMEAGNGTPPTATGYKCTIDTGATTYTVGETTSTTPPTVTVKADTTIKVTVTNKANCTPDITEPEKGSVEAVKEWTVTGLDPSTAPGFSAGTPGTLTFNGAEKSWTNNTTSYEVNTEVKVMEAGNGTPPTATGYKCTIDTGATTYTVGETTSTTPPTVTVKANTAIKVTVTNKANCTKDIPPPPATTTLTVTKVWAYIGTPAGYPTLGASNAGALNVTVGGTATGQAWGATKADLKVGDKAAVSEGAVPTPPAFTGYACTVTGSPEYAVNGDGFATTAASFPLAPSANTVAVRNTVTCVADSAVGGTEDEDTDTPAVDDSDSTDDEQVVAGSEDELASTGANTGPVGLGLLLILSGAAFITARRLALK